MRTTVTFADDVSAAIERLRSVDGGGLSEVVNELIRAGLARKSEEQPFVQRTAPLGLKIDVTNTWDAIESLDGPATR